MKFSRITVEVDKMGGMPCIRGLRIPVATVLGMVANGMSETKILAAYPDLEVDDIREALRYAAQPVSERELRLIFALAKGERDAASGRVTILDNEGEIETFFENTSKPDR